MPHCCARSSLRRAMLRTLALAAALQLCQAAPFVIRVEPGAAAASDSSTTTVGTLGEAAAAVAAALGASHGGEGSRTGATLLAADSDLVVELAAGPHRVPAGGLQLTAAHTPADRGRTVTWRCAAGDGSCSVHGGEIVSGPWVPCKAGACADPRTLVAPVPAALKGKTLRHFFVNGVRASRTRSSPGDLFGNPPHFGMRYFGPSNAGVGSQCTNSTPQPCPTNTSRNYCESVSAKDQCELPPVQHCPPCPPPGAAAGVASGYSVTNQTAAQGNFSAYLINSEDIEFIYPGAWAQARCAVQSVDAKRRRFTMQQPCHWNLYHRPWQPATDMVPESIDNVKAELKTQGQFYYDKAAGEVLYLPRDGEEDMSTATAVLAVEETLVQHSAAAQHSWQGVTFEYATWLRPMQGDGYVEVQVRVQAVCVPETQPCMLPKYSPAASCAIPRMSLMCDVGLHQTGACAVCPLGEQSSLGPPYNVSGCGGGDVLATIPGNVVATAGRDINFTSCTFQHLGGYAAAADGGSQQMGWHNCTFLDVSAGALMLGGLDTCDETDTSKWDKDFLVADNRITNIPIEYPGATTIFVGYVEAATLQHNLIENMSYSALSIGCERNGACH